MDPEEESRSELTASAVKRAWEEATQTTDSLHAKVTPEFHFAQILILLLIVFFEAVAGRI